MADKCPVCGLCEPIKLFGDIYICPCCTSILRKIDGRGGRKQKIKVKVRT